ncbi:hypothetical protein HU200_013087 [Digitaria exilis]|uniref:Uncharacterized protein n=1 Tax=Digitaria exilis TaxID=1010633 RepID=A0A835FE44_9POAL|nr:hypothetical protein HU200_013689 [Digitaria exilis]KAF8747955.1 hypothetical protein HU200_013087 [Digitaria exilis]
MSCLTHPYPLIKATLASDTTGLMKPIMLDNQILLPSYLSTSLRQKIEKVCICLHVPPSMLPLPRKGDYTYSIKN